MTSDVAADDSVTGNDSVVVADPSVVTAAAATPTVGRTGAAASSFRMVPTAVAVPSTAFVGDDSVSTSVSSGSTAVSPSTVTATVPLVCPAANVSVPVVAT